MFWESFWEVWEGSVDLFASFVEVLERFWVCFGSLLGQCWEVFRKLLEGSYIRKPVNNINTFTTNLQNSVFFEGEL